MTADLEQMEAHRPALTGHCYRMLGSAVDADDAVQETLIRAWKSIDRFDGRAALRTWLYRIATNLGLDELASRSRRARPMEEGPPSSGSPSPDLLVQRPRGHWIEPIADAGVLPSDADPSKRVILRESIRLAFVAALQNLAPKQRAVLLFANRDRYAPVALSASQQDLLNRDAAAFERYDVDELVSLLCQDAAFSMPPYALWLQGPGEVRTWMLGMGSGCRGSRLVRTAACGAPAFGQYRPDPEGIGHKPWALIVLELSGERIAGVNSFLDTGTLFPRFDLPGELPA